MSDFDEDELLAAIGEIAAGASPAPASAEPLKPGWLYHNLKKYYHYDLDPQPHAKMLAPLERALGDCQFKSGGKKLLLLGFPRGTYKSTLAAIGTTCEVLTHNPNARCLIDSYRHGVSKRRLKAARRNMELNRDGSPKNKAWADRYGTDWAPQFKELTWSDEEIIVTKRTDTAIIESSITTMGIDRSEVGGHYDYIVADDLVNDRNCRTPEQRDMVHQHILDLLPILDPNGVLVVIFTTWDPDDAYARIMKEVAKRKKAGEDPMWEVHVQGAYYEDGSLFFPRVLTHEHLADLKRAMGSHKFSAQYLLKPIASEDRTFNMDSAREVRFTFQPREYGGVIIIPRWANERRPVLNTLAWDPAGVKYNRKSDFHGLTVVGDDPMDVWWILEAAAIKGPPTSTKGPDGQMILGVVNRVADLVAMYHPHTLSCEDVQSQLLWINALQVELALRSIEMPAIHEYKPGNVPKNTRIAMLQPKWERGEIVYMPHMSALREQFEQFTLASEMGHEDILDSLVHHLFTARPAEPDLHLRDDNPVDLEALRRQMRLQGEQPGSGGGQSMTIWDV